MKRSDTAPGSFGSQTRSVCRSLLCIGILMPMEALAGNWGEPWGSFTWSLLASVAQAIPVNAGWLLAATSLAVALVGINMVRKKH